MNIIKKLVLTVIFIAGISGCSDSESDNISGNNDNSLGCEVIMFDIELDEREMQSEFTIENAVKCNGSSNFNVSFTGENAKYFLVNNKSELSYNLNNGVNQGNSLNLTFSTSPEADTMQETISSTIILKISNYSTMKKFNQEYAITRLK